MHLSLSVMQTVDKFSKLAVCNCIFVLVALPHEVKRKKEGMVKVGKNSRLGKNE